MQKTYLDKKTQSVVCINVNMHKQAKFLCTNVHYFRELLKNHLSQQSPHPKSIFVAPLHTIEIFAPLPPTIVSFFTNIFESNYWPNFQKWVNIFLNSNMDQYFVDQYFSNSESGPIFLDQYSDIGTNTVGTKITKNVIWTNFADPKMACSHYL